MLPNDKVRIQISLSKDLKNKAEQQAEKEERTLSNLISITLKKYLEEQSSSDKSP